MSEHRAKHRQEATGKGCGGAPAAVAPGATPVIDLACGMKVDPVASKHRHDHDGATYHSCCCGCHSKFAADPPKYMSQPAEALADVKTATDPVNDGRPQDIQTPPRPRIAFSTSRSCAGVSTMPSSTTGGQANRPLSRRLANGH